MKTRIFEASEVFTKKLKSEIGSNILFDSLKEIFLQQIKLENTPHLSNIFRSFV
jgi:hypothetical protein